MMKLVRLAALVAAGLLACAPAAGQRLNALPAAGTASGTDTVLAQQPSLCAAGTTCSGVLMTLDQVVGYANATGRFQPSDADLSAIAALSTQGYGRTLLTMTDAPTTRAYLGLGSNALDSTPRAPSARLINTTAPLTGGGDLSADRTLGISLATGVSAGAMSAGDKGKLDSVNVGASVSSVACAGTGGISCSVTTGTTAAQLTIAPGALTPASVAATGTVTGSNLSGTNTGDQIIALTGDVTGSGTGSFAATLAPSGVTAGTYGASGTLAVPVFSVDAKGRITASSSFTLGTSAGYAIGTSGGTIGLLNGSNTYSGAMTFSQLITGSVTGNAGTATKLATARTISGSGDTTWAITFDGSGNVTGTTTISGNAVTFAKMVAATQPALIGATAAGNFGEITPANGRTLLGVSATGADPNYALLSGATFTGSLRQSGGSQLRIENSGSAAASGATGTGLELYQQNGSSFVQSFDRTNSAFAPLGLSASIVRPRDDNATSLGDASHRWAAVYAGTMAVSGVVQGGRYCYTSTVCDYAGSGTPLGNVTASVGSTYRRTDGGSASTFYVKESGTDATGWVAK